MSNIPEPLKESWNSFSKDRARTYLKTFGHPSIPSKKMLTDLLLKESRNGFVDILRGSSFKKKISILELGCGNAQLYEYFKERGLLCDYTGVDFSETLLEAAKENNPEATFICDNVEELKKVTSTYDFVIYSHVIEMLSSPEASLLRAKELAKKIIIRFFEPPVFEVDAVELKMMETAEGLKVPYLRRKMSKDYYKMILDKMKCTKIDVHHPEHAKDEIHMLHY
ncbi:MAG: class I SAM-dependent methyltransferase [Candidatus Paceibacterota bacterium]